MIDKDAERDPTSPKEQALVLAAADLKRARAEHATAMQRRNDAIRAMLQAGFRISYVARLAGVTTRQVTNIHHGRTGGRL